MSSMGNMATGKQCSQEDGTLTGIYFWTATVTTYAMKMQELKMLHVKSGG